MYRSAISDISMLKSAISDISMFRSAISDDRFLGKSTTRSDFQVK